jgi:predicted AAA+ superfamily ATPase
MISESSENEIDNTRAFLKMRLQRDLVTFRNHDSDWKMIRDLLLRTAKEGESNSVLLIGPRGCGKSTVSTTHIVHYPV